jgi:hypothetical protein
MDSANPSPQTALRGTSLRLIRRLLLLEHNSRTRGARASLVLFVLVRGAALLLWSGCGGCGFASPACMPSLMAARPSLVTMGAPPFPPLHPVCSGGSWRSGRGLLGFGL